MQVVFQIFLMMREKSANEVPQTPPNPLVFATHCHHGNCATPSCSIPLPALTPCPVHAHRLPMIRAGPNPHTRCPCRTRRTIGRLVPAEVQAMAKKKKVRVELR